MAIAAALWFIAVVWLAFAAGPEIDYLLVIVTLFFIMFFVLFPLLQRRGPALAFAHAAPARISRQRDWHCRQQDERT
jgi:cell division protein FtsW (lipid II flippase)